MYCGIVINQLTLYFFALCTTVITVNGMFDVLMSNIIANATNLMSLVELAIILLINMMIECFIFTHF